MRAKVFPIDIVPVQTWLSKNRTLKADGNWKIPTMDATRQILNKKTRIVSG